MILTEALINGPAVAYASQVCMVGKATTRNKYCSVFFGVATSGALLEGKGKVNTLSLRVRMNTAWLAFLFFIWTGPVLAAPPAFPGAEGGGALSVGGRGGVLCEVTNLNDSGPGSFRACVTMQGPRTVIFRTGGTIELKSGIEIRNPYLTIAGQTAPGGGIQISGKNIVGWEGDLCKGITPLVFWSGAHDVIMRHVRIRKGLHDPVCKGGPNVLQFGGNVHDIIVDHVSLYWAHDQILGMWSWGTGPRSITVQNSIMAEPLKGHAVSTLIGGANPDARMTMTNIDLVGNIIANATHRNPAFGARSGRFINNIVYNWSRGGGPLINNGAHYDVIGNLFSGGPMPKSSSQFHIVSWPYRPTASWWSDRYMKADPSIYVLGNRGSMHPDPEVDNWQMVKEREGSHGALVGPLSEDYRRFSPLEPAGVPITVRHVEEVEDHVLPRVGASKGLDCAGNWVERRDAQDTRLIDWYLTNRGFLVADEDEVGGFPTLAQGLACADTSGDGIPDEWLVRHGLDPLVAIGPDIHSSGYSYLELYLNGMGLSGVTVAQPPEPPPALRVE